MAEVFGFDAEGVERIQDALDMADNLPTSVTQHPQHGGRPRFARQRVAEVRVTSSTLGAHGYPAKFQSLDGSQDPPACADLGDCWVRELNGGVPNTDKFVAKMIGQAADGKIVCELLFPVGWTGTFQEVSDVT